MIFAKFCVSNTPAEAVIIMTSVIFTKIFFPHVFIVAILKITIAFFAIKNTF
jgi:hypothetical protein